MNTKKERGKIDWMITLVPLAIVIALCVLFFFAPKTGNASRVLFKLEQIEFLDLSIFIVGWIEEALTDELRFSLAMRPILVISSCACRRATAGGRLPC